ncbi:hypothetical protein GCM10010387_18090 [Streptomyces inusitatus]|uniref:Uncharacterized protein n=1 Tax=Streptomyces inusitatus TaxID=68221 RepID=A0A918UPR3_9ACTN|nr:hypothetical protein [Streptomyces inusitatus]GGZ25003.1 hypothetical protein GCM10010387_18090 [Streptomyces inusitatus]
MRQRLTTFGFHLLITLAVIAATAAVWASWLGWDQVRDEAPDGSSTGPYEAWQVIGLVLTLLLPLCWAATRRYHIGAVVGIPIGLTAASYYDWQADDTSGLFAIGVAIVLAASIAATVAVSSVVKVMAESRQRRASVA